MSTSSSNENESDVEPNDKFCVPSTSSDLVKSGRGKVDFITDRLVAVLDRCKISDRDAVHLLVAVAEALGHDVHNLIINRTSIKNRRQNIRQNVAECIKKNFNTESNAVILHWDGKLLPSSKLMRQERLPVIVTFDGTEQLLGVPKLNSGTGEQIAASVFQLLLEWNLTEKVNALCCDTTVSNTGTNKGACAILEKKLNKELLYLPCRHHIYEIILRSVFELKMKHHSSGPEIQLFKRFQIEWNKMDLTKFSCGVEDDEVKIILNDVICNVKTFCSNELKQNYSRDDYKEFLELALIFLGGDEQSKITFKTPGAIHHARWLAKALYSFKIYLFRKQFKLTKTEEKGLRDICIFLIRLYIKAWFTAPLAIKAPNQDFNFLKNLSSYYDNEVAQTALKKICGHLWYLNDENIALAFFDDEVPNDLKKKMSTFLIEKKNATVTQKKLSLKPEGIKNIISKDLSFLVSTNTNKFFERFNIDKQFLTNNPDTWSTNQSFIKGLETVKNIKVVNDTAERGVKLIEEYNNLITKDEDQTQYLLQIVKNYRSQYPDCNKSSLT